MKTDPEKLAAASDPSTPADTLAALAESSDSSILRALAANPNTPEDLLRRLWEDHPECLLENPILTLWEFTRAGSVRTLVGDKPFLRLYNHLRATGAELPSRLFTHDTLETMISRGVLHQDPEVFAFAPREEQASLRIHFLYATSRRRLFDFFEEHAPDQVWMGFATDPDPEVRLEFGNLLRSTSHSAEPSREVYAKAARALFEDSPPESRLHLANCRFLPSDLVERLAGSTEVEIREALTRCVHAGIPTLRRLAADPSVSVRLSLARACELEEIHRLLVRDPAADVRRRLAENKSVSRATLEEFDPRDLPEVVRAVFLANKADSALRARLVREADPVIHSAIVELGPRYTAAFHRATHANYSEDTRARLAQAPGLPRPIVEELARDPSPKVRLGVARRLGNSYNRGPSPTNLALLKRLASDPVPSVRLQVCTDPRLDRASTAALFQDPDPVIRKKCVTALLEALEARWTARKLESYERLYEEKAALVTVLARDPDHAVRFAIAKSNETPPAAKGILFNDPEAFIREAFLNQTHWPYGVLLDLEKRLVAKEENRFLRHGVTTPSTSALRILAKSRNPFERLLTARCRRTPNDALRDLARDRHPAIRESALDTLQRKSKRTRR